ncbi:UNVERIFIED_CONTAM: hypothetical protein NCL1_33772 [Trichonephila clavipes]
MASLISIEGRLLSDTPMISRAKYCSVEFPYVIYPEHQISGPRACDAEDCGFQMLNDDEIVTSVQEESDPVDDETNEDEGNSKNEK